MAATLPKLEGLLSIVTAVAVDITEIGGGGSATVTIVPVGDYYLTTANGSTAALLSTIGDALTNDVTLSGTYTLTLDDNADTSLGRVTITATGITSFTLTWSADTTIRDTLGFTGTLTPTAASFVGTKQARRLWLPGCGRSEPDAPDGDSGRSRKKLTVLQAPDGTSYAMTTGTAHAGDRYTFARTRGQNVWTSLEATTNESFQTFWTDVLSLGYPFKYHKLRDTDGTATAQFCTDAQDLNARFVDPNWVGAAAWCAVSMTTIPYT